MTSRESLPRSAPTRRLFEPVDCASLAFFRFVFGLAIAFQAAKFWWRGWIEDYYIEPGFFFTYCGFGWVHPWPGDGTYYQFAAMIVLGLLVAAGFLYRASAVLLFLTVAHWFLLDTTHYNNHYYLEVLIAFLLVFVPANRAFSIDARLRPGSSASTVPSWTMWLLRFQIGVVYLYGGLAKLDPDWLTGVPVRAILGSEAPWLGRSAEAGRFLAGSGLLLDLFVVPFLLWRRTRWIAFLVALGFHLSNAFLFRIGVFPWFMAAATLIYFEPDWPRRVLGFFGLRGRPAPAPPAVAAAAPGRNVRITLCALAAYAALQLLFPLRHFLYPGRVTWTEEGLRFAWHMMSRHKLARSQFVVESRDGEPLPVQLRPRVTAKQYEYMQYEPAAILQFAHHLADEARSQGFEGVRVRAEVYCSLNGREPQFLVDPETDLAAEQETWRPYTWIVPLEERLPPASPYGGNLDAPGN